MKRALACSFAVMMACVAAACGSTPPVGSQTQTTPGTQPIAKSPSSSRTVPINYEQIPIKAGAEPQTGLVPWVLIRTDTGLNRVYLSATQTGCTAPDSVYLVETASEIRITVTAPATTSDQCTEQERTLIGYIQLKTPIDDRRITGNDR